MRRILEGKSSSVAHGMLKSAALRQLTPQQRSAVDKCANYLLNNRAYLQYDDYLAAGFPIATGVIEGACRYLIKDRMDITGARWSLSCPTENDEGKAMTVDALKKEILVNYNSGLSSLSLY